MRSVFALQHFDMHNDDRIVVLGFVKPLFAVFATTETHTPMQRVLLVSHILRVHYNT